MGQVKFADMPGSCCWSGWILAAEVCVLLVATGHDLLRRNAFFSLPSWFSVIIAWATAAGAAVLSCLVFFAVLESSVVTGLYAWVTAGIGLASGLNGTVRAFNMRQTREEDGYGPLGLVHEDVYSDDSEGMPEGILKARAEFPVRSQSPRGRPRVRRRASAGPVLFPRDKYDAPYEPARVGVPVAGHGPHYE